MCENILRDNPNSRQAIIHIKPARNIIDEPTKDLPCTVSLQFFIRNNQLYLTTYMRSNDIWMGFPYDVFQFTCLQIYLAMRLNVNLGTYTHITGSLHLYKRNVKEVIDED
jgi:thymidylate synthase